ncbi:hypothetical protein ACSJLU_003183 [Serratia bockelmannii]
MVVLTERVFRFSLFISQLLAKAIPVRGAIFREARSGKPERAFCYSARRESDIFGVAAVQVVPSAEPQGKAENKDQKIQHIRHNQHRMYA